ncbi:CDC27 family protein [Selenomonas ruminantium]|uniref:CDC27 family protein n=1 Tax=Selenomonas ruminantium TaxID=971 RepID=UPI0004227665|nr:CDC27 family protein [Selenomonas ruminantium]
MGKNSKKMNKKKNQQKSKLENQQIQELKAQLTQQMDDMQYADALSTLAELIEKQCYDPEVIFQGAQAYFLIGDYERGIAWIDNTLHFAPEHIGARLLLAKICLLEERIDDAMALYTFVLQNYPQRLTDAEREDIKEGADYTWRTDREWLVENYPLVAELWNEKEPQPVPINDSNLKPMEDKAETVEQGNNDTAAAEDIIKQVFAKDASLTEKVKLLNKFAGGYFIARDFANAQLLLEKALEIDSYYTKTLANLAVLSKVQGDVDKALAYAAEMPEVDFVLLQALVE